MHDSCVYHVLEEAVSSDSTTIPTTSNQPELAPHVPKRKSNTAIPADGVLNYNESSQQNINIQEQLLDQSRIEESKERVFDDPQYDIFPICNSKAHLQSQDCTMLSFAMQRCRIIMATSSLSPTSTLGKMTLLGCRSPLL